MTNNYDELKKLAEAATPLEADLYGDRYFQGPHSRADLTKEQDAFYRACTPAVVSGILSELTALRAAASAPKAELTDERAAFDHWAQVEYRNADRYPNSAYQYGLEAWQARAVLAQAAPVAVPAKPVARVSHAEEGFADVELLGDVMVGDELYACAAPAAPIAAAVPAGWVKNTGVQPVADEVLVAAIFEDGFRDTGKASSFVWDIADGDPTNVAHYLVLPAAPAPDGAAS